MTIQGTHTLRRRYRRALRRSFRATFETLEPRTLFAGTLLYINDNWHITTDTGVAGLSNGDTVDSASDDGSLHGLTFGTDAFGDLVPALSVATTGDTLVFVPGSYGAAFSGTLTTGVSLMGWNAFATTYASPAVNPDPTHLTQSSLSSTLSSTLTAVQLTLADPAADATSVAGFKFTGYGATGAIVLATTNHAIVTIAANNFSGGATAKAVIVNGGTALVTANTMTGHAAAIVLQGGSATASGNRIIVPFNANGIQIAGGSALAVTGNVLTGASALNGVSISDNNTFAGNLNVLISGNTVSGMFNGIGIDGQTEPAAATITANNFPNDVTAILLQGNSSSAAILANVFSGATTAIDAQGGAAAITSNTISNSTTAVLFENAIGGGPASGTLTANRFNVGTPNNTDLDIAAAPGLIFAGGNHFGASAFFINNESPDSYTLHFEDFGTRDGAAVADKIVDQADDEALGKINYNLALTIDSYQQNHAAIHLGEALNISGTYSDQISPDPHQLHINWGDGTLPETLPITGGTFSFNHTYAAAGSDSISIYLIAADGATSSITTGTLVVLDAPVVTAAYSPTTIPDGGSIMLAGDISESGTHTFTLNVNWGNSVQGIALGNMPFSIGGLSWNPVTRHFTVSHDYIGVVPSGSTATTFTPMATVTDNEGAGSNAISQVITVTAGTLPTGTVAARRIFYKGSVFQLAGDDVAIAPDKFPLFPGQLAGSANYTSYSLGINGLMVDITGSPSGIVPADFSFAVGNDNFPDLWTPVATAPTLNVRPGAGAGGSTRVEILFPDGLIKNQWLQVTVHANVHTGLAAPDTFYFGNAIAEAGNSPSDAKVNATDELAARFAATTSAGITNAMDYNRDGKVDGADIALARANYTYFLNELNLISIAAPAGSANLLPALPMGPMSPGRPPLPVPSTVPLAPAGAASILPGLTILPLTTRPDFAPLVPAHAKATLQLIKVTLTRLKSAAPLRRH
ncbi:MAG TPA: NosD domain-containing protein [Phycisphaerae bacterium]|nr:NosD domain-containing protein [Phycisphaerae bacterium]